MERCYTVEGMIDYETLVAALTAKGHTVGDRIEVPSNAGTAELRIDGKLVTLEEARAMLEDAELT